MQDFGPFHFKVHFPPDRGAAVLGWKVVSLLHCPELTVQK